MNLLYAAYTALTSGIFLAGFTPFWLYTRLSGRYRRGLEERLGFIPRTKLINLKCFPRIWIHSASLGEVRVAAPIIESLKTLLPNCSVMLSTTTDHGFDLAMEIFKDDIPVIYAPIDTMLSVRAALSRIRPDVMVFLETEIWPSWISESHRMGIKTALVNGRISSRSIDGYLRLKPFFRKILQKVQVFSMIKEEDARRIKAMGVDPGRIIINGNAKYDFLADRVDPAMEAKMERALNLDSSTPVIIAGSTREGEEDMILDAYESIREEFPETILVIVPRHIDRTPEIGSLFEKRGYPFQLRSEMIKKGVKRKEPVVIMDTFGELFELYSVGTIVFCGASLVPLGGQNPLEPAAWGKVVFYGPSMDDFLDAKALLEKNNAGIEVSGPEMLAERAIWFLRNPDSIKRYGARAREAVLKNRNAAEKHAKVIFGLLDT